MQSFGKFLRDLRVSKELSLTELARKAGVEKGYLSGVENEKVNPPSARVVRMLAKVLKHDTKDLLLRACIEKAPKEIQQDLVRALFPEVAA